MKITCFVLNALNTLLLTVVFYECFKLLGSTGYYSGYSTGALAMIWYYNWYLLIEKEKLPEGRSY